MNFKKYFKLPLRLDFDGDLVFTDDDLRAFDFTTKKDYKKFDFSDKNSQQLIVGIINGDVKMSSTGSMVYSQGTIYIRDKEKDNNILREFIIIRGYGHLTGTLKLNENKAKSIQDDFAKFIIKQLS